MLRTHITIACIAACTSLSGFASAQTIQIDKNNKTIAISTSDEATATADIAAVTVGFEVYGPDSTSAYTSGGNVSHAVLEALHKAGVEDKSIESTGQSLQRNTDFDEKDKPEQRAARQFVFSQSWEVSVPPQSAAEVIRVAVAAGANKSGAIDWRLSDRKTLQAKAAAAALIKARAVASQMADGLHVRLGDLIYASNETPNTQIFFKRPGMVLNTESAGLASRINLLPSLEIRPQTIREEATVYAVFAIE
ncbi:MAG TPA: SIMPL domain-containing protein [Terracidiphilus sp.]|nr:SIMPL domain-containing protein [Terracidiphilus sp.]